MASYLISRLLRWSVGLALVAVVSYAMMYYGAGDPIKRMFQDMEAGGVEVDAATMEAIRAAHGLDKPFPEQFTNYITHLLQGDWGTSIRERRPVWDMVRNRLPISMQIGLVATLFSLLIGLPLGVAAAFNHNRWLDQLIVGSSVFVNAVPIFVTGPLLLLFLVLGLQVMNVPFGWKGIFHPQVILPVAILALGPLPTIIRQTRAGVLDVMGEDYIRTAKAKGMTQRIIVMRHMMRPVLIPVATAVGLILISLVNGALFVELIFNIPGFGKMTVQGVQQVDYPVIMANVLVGAMIVMVGNLLIDLAYPLLDPRITRG
jgi:ABC-type dipeptide/oligopeptide/nickel transport system permease component